MITSLDRTHAGFYRCIVRNRMGALLQRQTEVQVACEYGVTGGGRGRACSGRGSSPISHTPSVLLGAHGGRPLLRASTAAQWSANSVTRTNYQQDNNWNFF